MNRFLKIGGVFQPLGLQAPVGAILSPPSAWAANVQVFLNPGSNSLSLSAKGIKGVSPFALVNWLWLNNIVDGNGGAAAIDLSGNALPTDQVDALVSYLAIYALGGIGFTSLDLSGGTNAKPTIQAAPVNLQETFSGDDVALGVSGRALIREEMTGQVIAELDFIETDTANSIIAAFLGLLNAIYPGCVDSGVITFPLPFYSVNIYKYVEDGVIAIENLTTNVITPYSPEIINAGVLAMISAGVTVTTNN